MGKAVADPEEIRRFAQALKKFNGSLSTSMQSLNGQMIALGQTWRDQEHAKFAAEFEQTLRQLQRFAEAADEQIPFLLRKADRIEEYLRQR
ncbi:MAG: WXG100 family type VII secretion target [Phycisphaerales bacterium]